MTPQPTTGNERNILVGQRLGRLPLKTTRKALQFSEFFGFIEPPPATRYWVRKPELARRTYGNDRMGNCTRAKQAYAAIRMERIEQRRTINIPDDEVVRVYVEMSNRLYGGGDNGAYEDDALNEWRNPETTFRDDNDRPLTIQGYLRINALNPKEVKAGIAMSAAKGIAVCFNLPIAFQDLDTWDLLSDSAPLTGNWQPGTWGGHSMWMIDYDKQGATVDDTWGHGPRRVTWRAIAAYMDEAHLCMDSIDAWRKVAETRKIKGALGDVADAINAVSSLKVKLR